MLARILKKTRSSIYYEIKTNMVKYGGRDKFNPTEEEFICVRLVKFPFTCNGCPNTRCSHRNYMYLTYNADKKVRHALVSSRSDTLLKRNNIKIINQTVSPLILIGQSIYAATDNGTEFKNLYKLEVDDNTGEVYCKTFYIDPYRACQKAECERNHCLFRRIKPKVHSFNLITQEEVDDIFSHINSYPRSSLNGKTPYELFSTEYNPIILTDINIHQISRTKVNLKNR